MNNVHNSLYDHFQFGFSKMAERPLCRESEINRLSVILNGNMKTILPRTLFLQGSADTGNLKIGMPQKRNYELVIQGSLEVPTLLQWHLYPLLVVGGGRGSREGIKPLC